MFGRNLASILAAAGLLGMAAAGTSVIGGPALRSKTRRTSKTRGKGSINYAARAARSHAGKPAGYVKAY